MTEFIMIVVASLLLATIVVLLDRHIQGLRETELLLSSPKNAARLRYALAQAKAGELVEFELDDSEMDSDRLHDGTPKRLP